MKTNALPEKTVTLWQIRLTIIAVIPVAVLASLCFLTLWLLLAAAVTAAVFCVLILWYIPALLHSYEILFPSGAIVIKCGVFLKTTHIMPFSRMVCANSLATPLARKMRLSALTLKAARSRIIIPELDQKDVSYFIDYLTREDGE